MGLIADTLRDARRSLVAPGPPQAGEPPARDAGGGAAAPVAEEYLTRPLRESAAAGVCEVQEEGQHLSREASFQFGGGERRLPAGDPLSAGMDAERPKSLATNVGLSDVSVGGDKRESKLATGQDQGRSPGKVAAAKVSSESKTHQSEVLPGPIEAESDHQRQRSTTPEGSARSVSRPVETFLSRPSGRGAPPGRLPTSAAGTAPGSPAPGRAESSPGGTPCAPGEAGPLATAVIPSVAPTGRAAPPAAADAADAADAAGRGASSRLIAAARGPRAAAASGAAHASDRGATPREPEFAPPSLCIGRIDVTVLADSVPPTSAASPPGEPGFLSRNYLRRL